MQHLLLLLFHIIYTMAFYILVRQFCCVLLCIYLKQAKRKKHLVRNRTK